MIVLRLSACPPGLRGDVTRWLFEIGTGVYVGNLSARVRDSLWERVCKYTGVGEATMVYSARNEQGFAVRIHNTTLKPVDYDGIILMRKPLPISSEKRSPKTDGKRKFKKLPQPNDSQEPKEEELAQINERTECHKRTRKLNNNPVPYEEWPMDRKWPADFTVIDTETTGLDAEKDFLIEIAAVRVRNCKPQSEFQSLIRIDGPLPEEIVKLTGITNSVLECDGICEREAIEAFLSFVNQDIIVAHNAAFDVQFIQSACKRQSIVCPRFCAIDTVRASKSKLSGRVSSLSLLSLVRYFALAEEQSHRALPDARLVVRLLEKLNEITPTEVTGECRTD